jgi:hypothetical protein
VSRLEDRQAAAGPNGDALRAATLVYQGRHQGDHPTWSYRHSVTIDAADRAGRQVWRRTSRYVDDTKVAGAIDLDRRTLEPIHSELLWNGATVRLDYAAGQTTGVIEQNGAQRAVSYRHNDPVVLADALDLFVAALPLAPGYRSRVVLLDFWLLTEPTHYQTRAFEIRVDREDLVTVPAGPQRALVVTIEPTDGDERLKAVYHVATTAPHYAIRMEYVVNPRTVGDEKRSVGVDELVSATPPPGS